MAAHLNVEDVRGVQAHEAVLGLKVDQVAAARAHGLQHALELEGKDRVLDGLDHKVKGADLVAANGVLLHVGHKDDLGAHAATTQLVGGVHAVHLGHLYVQQDDVVGAGGSGIQELGAVRVLADGHALALLRAEAPDHLSQLRANVLLVVHDGNVKHRDPPFDTHRIRKAGRRRQGLFARRQPVAKPTIPNRKIRREKPS